MKTLVTIFESAWYWLYPCLKPALATTLPEIDVDEEVPRYPPFAKGLPVASVGRVLARQQDMLVKIRQIFPFTREEYDHLILPILQRYAAYVHLLPASEHHHHKGAGGLLRHGLEVAFFAGRSSDAFVFLPEGTPLERKRVEIRWKVAIFIAGLLHDAGKPITNLSVVNEDGSLVWNPFSGSINEWANKYRIERYFLRWKDKRKQQDHTLFGADVIDRIVPSDTMVWLNDGETEMYAAIRTYLAGIISPKHKLAELVGKADSDSVEMDLQASGHGKIRDPGFGVPVEQFVVDAMRRLVADGTWTVNEQGSRVWLISDGFSEGLYIVWKRACDDIIGLLQQDRVPGIPRNPDTLADILIERNLAEARKLSNNSFRYWPVAPDLLTQNGQHVRLLMLRLQAPTLLFNEPPPFVGGVIDPQGPKQPSGQTPAAAPGAPTPPPNVTAGDQGSTTAAQPAQPTSSPPPPPTPSGPVCSACQTAQPTPIPPDTEWTCFSCGVVHSPPPAASPVTVVRPGTNAGAPPPVSVSKPNIAVPSAASNPAYQGQGGKSGLPKSRKNGASSGADWWPADAQGATPAAPAATTALPPASPSTPSAEQFRSKLAQQGFIGRLLLCMCDDLASGSRMWGECLAQVGDCLLVRLPEGFHPYSRFELAADDPDHNPLQLGRMLADTEWVEADSFGKKVQIVAGVKGIVFRKEIATVVEAIVGDGNRPANAPPSRAAAKAGKGKAPEHASPGHPTAEDAGPAPSGVEQRKRPPPSHKAPQASAEPKPENVNIVQAIEHFLAHVRADPCPEGVCDEGVWRTVNLDLIHKYTAARKITLSAFAAALTRHDGVKEVDGSFLISTDEVQRG